MGFAFNPGATYGAFLGAASGTPKAPNAPKSPDYSAFVTAFGGNTAPDGKSNKGSANTFLTGSTGIDPSLLKLGKQTLLGG